MIERAIENWLTKTNERNYQAAFCQILMHQGHTVIYRSSHCPMEQGKDIISVDQHGDCCCYQLKTGNIDLKQWRLIRGEIQELIELPVVHPSVTKDLVHKSFLVTNGEVTDEVRIQIDQINDDNVRKGRNYSYLDVINGQTLIKQFVEAQGRFIPTELEDFASFLRFFLSDGAEFLDKDQFFQFLDRLFFGKVYQRISDSVNSIYSSVILTSYCLRPYQERSNHYALFEGWTCLAASICRYAYKSQLPDNLWNPSLEIVTSEIVRSLLSLKDETLSREDFIEGDWLGDAR